nr:DUF2141 domain-containing protein [Erythrobacter sp. HKB08]
MQLRTVLQVLGSPVRNGSRAGRRLSQVGLLALAAIALPANSAASSSSIKVTVTELRNTKGVVRACLTPDPDDFPKCEKGETAHSVVVPAGETVTLTFENVRPGRYAIALLHDENNNNKADRALLMMPKEGFGFSRDAKVRMGPPKFDAAAIDVPAGASRQTIRMRYML